MNCNIITVDEFKRDAKKLLKKYTSLKTELSELQAQLQENPRMGTQILENTYKIRLAVKSKGKGKSGGLRVITFIVEIHTENEEPASQTITVFLVSIYDKSDMENIADSDIKNLISGIKAELDQEGE